ncbi:MAG: tetratricopeptide repeat protein [Bacteroidales bacterium]|nr:tetratricopeptide repeat protein [Bacteroidales bacterium]
MVTLFFSCTGPEKSTKARSEKNYEEYYNLFTEATKYALLGDVSTLNRAISYYNLCISKFPEKAAPYYQLSNIYLSVNNIQKAKSYGKQAIEADGTNKWYLINLANIYQYQNNIDSVVYLYERIVALDSTNTEYLYNLAVFYSKQGNIRKSMDIINALERDIPDAREVLIMKYRNYNALNMKDSAVYELERIVKLFPEETESYGLLAEYLSEINRFNYAGKIYRELLRKDSGNGLANISYGDYFLKQNLKDSALFYYQRGFEADEITIEDKIRIVLGYLYDPIAVQSDTTFIETLLNKLKEVYPEDSRPNTLGAEYYVKRQNYLNALHELENAIQNNADAYIVYEQYIMISNFVGNYDNVVNIYKQALDKFPDKIALFVYTAYALYANNYYDRAIEIVQRGESIEGNKPDDLVQILNIKADSYRALKDYVKSDSIFEEILKIDNENLIVRNNYSYYLSLRNEKLDRAEELSYFTIQKDPNNPTFLDTYGWILFVQGKKEEALKYIERAIKNGAHNNPEVLDHYGDALLLNKRCKDAIEAWEYALNYGYADIEKITGKINNAKIICGED